MTAKRVLMRLQGLCPRARALAKAPAKACAPGHVPPLSPFATPHWILQFNYFAQFSGLEY